MKVAVVTIGNELLDGARTDTNTAYLGRRLTALGADMVAGATVRDDAGAIERALTEMSEVADVVITTGGLGVTADDRTRQAVARHLGRKLVLDEDVLSALRQLYESAGRQMPEINISQAMIPEGARPIENQRGTAPGLFIDAGETLLFILPGVPAELQSMFNNFVGPYLEGRGLKPLAQERTLRTTGIPESEIAERVGELAKRLARTDIAYLPNITGVDLRVVGRGATPAEAAATADRSAEKVAAKLEPYVYSRGEESLETVVGYLLSMEGLTLAVAESCTGGRLGWRLTRVPGSSDYFVGGVISYADDIKKRVLGVKAGTLRTQGAVSRETALEMVSGVRKRFRSDAGVAITGIAGPGGGSEEKPVGLVYVAVSVGKKERVLEYRFSGNRGAIRRLATQAALEALRRALLGIEDD